MDTYRGGKIMFSRLSFKFPRKKKQVVSSTYVLSTQKEYNANSH